MAEPVQDVEGWTDWHGGTCPVPRDARVEIQTRNGDKETRGAPWLHFDWRHDPENPYDADIIAYRVLSQDSSNDK